MDGNVLERICDPSEYSLDDAKRLGAALLRLDAAVSREISDLVERKKETWSLATMRRARAILETFGRNI